MSNNFEKMLEKSRSRILPQYTVMADADTGEWIGTPVYVADVNAGEWYDKKYNDTRHYDTYQFYGEGLDGQTRAIEIVLGGAKNV